MFRMGNNTTPSTLKAKVKVGTLCTVPSTPVDRLEDDVRIQTYYKGTRICLMVRLTVCWQPLQV